MRLRGLIWLVIACLGAASVLSIYGAIQAGFTNNKVMYLFLSLDFAFLFILFAWLAIRNEEERVMLNFLAAMSIMFGLVLFLLYIIS